MTYDIIFTHSFFIQGVIINAHYFKVSFPNKDILNNVLFYIAT